MPKIDLTPVEIDMIDKMIVNEKLKLYKKETETDNEEHQNIINSWIKRLAKLQIKLGTFV